MLGREDSGELRKYGVQLGQPDEAVPSTVGCPPPPQTQAGMGSRCVSREGEAGRAVSRQRPSLLPPPCQSCPWQSSSQATTLALGTLWCRRSTGYSRASWNRMASRTSPGLSQSRLYPVQVSEVCFPLWFCNLGGGPGSPASLAWSLLVLTLIVRPPWCRKG